MSCMLCSGARQICITSQAWDYRYLDIQSSMATSIDWHLRAQNVVSTNQAVFTADEITELEFWRRLRRGPSEQRMRVLRLLHHYTRTVMGWEQYGHSPKTVLKACRDVGTAISHSIRQRRWNGRAHCGLGQFWSGTSPAAHSSSVQRSDKLFKLVLAHGCYDV
jgi:hypothetical protein